jgi:hypothetical protein
MSVRCTIPGDVACARVDDGAVLLHMGTKRYFSLNETGGEVWRLLEEGTAIDDIPQRLHERFDVTVDDARAAVDELIKALAAEQLLELEQR